MTKRTPDARALSMKEQYLRGETYTEIGKGFGVSRQYVHQVLHKYFGEIIDARAAKLEKEVVRGYAYSTSSHSKLEFVYVIQAQNGLIKIGHSRAPDNRVEAVNLHSPVPARLIAKWQGRMKDEMFFHRKFAAHRAHNEWFRPEGDILTFVDEIFGQGLDDPVVDWGSFTDMGREERKLRARSRRKASLKAAWSDQERKKEWLRMLALGREQKRQRRLLTPSPAPEQAA